MKYKDIRKSKVIMNKFTNLKKFEHEFQESIFYINALFRYTVNYNYHREKTGYYNI